MARVAVIGAGYWGPNLIRNFMSHGILDGVTACDIDAKRLATMAKQFPGLDCMTDFEALLKRTDVDACVIATPVRFHYPMAKAALLAGKHVLMEKPMTMNSAQGRELIELADSKKLTLMVDHTFIFTGAVEKIAEICASDFGDFYYVDSVRINLGLFQHDVNVIWDLAPHDLSIVNHVLKRKPRLVRATGQSHTDSKLADVAYLNVEYGDNIGANFHCNWLSPTKIRQMIFAGSNRMIVWNDLDPAEKLRVYDKGINFNKKIDKEGQYALQFGYRSGDAWLPRTDNAEALKKMTGHFMDCFMNGKRPLTGGREGLEVVMTLEASDMSLASGGRPVAIDGEKISLA